MNNDQNYRITQWQPPTRPEWVQRINDEGRHLDIKGIVPLDAESLIATAKANTGLSDFGVDGWREPLEIFLKGLNEEADLNLMGRILTRSDILMYLEARLRVEEEYKKHPEIENVELAPPMLIVGSGRSGTSALQNLLACDPDNGTPKHWEALFPAPAPEAANYRSDPRIPIADARMTQWNRVTPEMVSIHEFAGEMPTELIQLEGMTFQSEGWLIFCGFTPSYVSYLAPRSKAPALAYAKRVMKLLQWKNPRQRWLLKSPDSMRYLPDVFEVFPNMQLIWIHRDPLKTISSVVSLIGTILWQRSDRKLDARATAQLTNPAGLAGLFSMVMDQMDKGQIPASQIRHVQYMDFLDDPMGVIEKLYRDMGVTLSDAARKAMTDYLAAHPRESRPAHKYNVDVAARIAEERKLFARYAERFQVKNEV